MRDSSAYELADFFDFLSRYAAFIASFIAVGLIVSLVIIFSVTEIYTASSTLVFDRNDTRPYEAVLELQKQERDKSAMETEMDLLKSREFLGFVVDDLRLMDDPYFNTRLPPADRKEASFWQLRWSPQLAEAGVGDKASPEKLGKRVVTDPANRDRVITRLAAALSASRKGDSLAMTIFIEHPHAEKAAEIANGVAANYVVWSTRMKQLAAKATVDYLRSQADAIALSIAKKEREIAEFTTRSDLTFDPRDDVLKARTEQLNEQFTLARVEEAGAWAKHNEATRLVAAAGLDAAGGVLTSDLLSALRIEEGELERKRAQLTAKFGRNHPLVMETDAQLASNKRGIETEITRVVQELENDAKVATVRVRKFQEEVGQLQKQMQDRNLDEIRRRELDRDLLAEQKRYDAVMLRLGVLDPEQEQIIATARIASFAEIPIDPSFPRPGIILPVGALASLALGLVASVAHAAIDTRIRTSRVVDSIVNRPTLVAVPDMRGSLEPGQDLYQTMLADPHSLFSRAMRSLCLAWRTYERGSQSKVVMFCSSGPGEGKTTCALGMAGTAAINGLRVVVLDLDPGPQSAASVLGIASPPQGFPVASSTTADVDSMITQAPEYPFLRGMASRLALVDPQRLFDELRRRFDLIVIDPPSVASDDDAIWISSYVDAVVLVVAAEKAVESDLLATVERLSMNGAPIAGSVFNFCRRTRNKDRGKKRSLSVRNFRARWAARRRTALAWFLKDA
ncbi:Uncharacterized protein involved in exopolysaccharide biosynthesis [Sinorhizobium sp. NFACC03]|nr:Uncharacterized protein involved in exopolysaccharide biosynthesis [Sinorhizobium sp. NFACC03]